MRQCPACGSLYENVDFCAKDGSALPPPAAPAPADPFVGRLIAGRYELKEYLGGGTMGVVYRAGHNVLERDFAVKLLRKEFVADDKTLRRFLREARVASLVDHDHIVRIHDFGQTDEGEPYLVMEHVTGLSLFKVITEQRKGRLPLGRALDIMIQVARALAHAHARGVIHRDIKPENIVLRSAEGEQAGLADFVKILDFGVAKILGQPAISTAGEVLGTPEFLAPEGLLGTEVAAPADLYALGAMLHDAIVGSPPFSGSLRDILHQHLTVTPLLLSQRSPELRVPPTLDDLVRRLLLKEPQERPTAEEAANLLAQVRLTINERPDRIDPVKTMIMPRGVGELSQLSLQLPPRLLALANAEAQRLKAAAPAPGPVTVEVAPLPGLTAALLHCLYPAGALPAKVAGLKKDIDEHEQAEAHEQALTLWRHLARLLLALPEAHDHAAQRRPLEQLMAQIDGAQVAPRR